MSVVLAVDLGGTGLRAGLFDAEGAEVATAHRPLAFVEDPTGRSEQDPALWWEALGEAVDLLAQDRPAGLGDVAAVALCGFTRTQVFLDRRGRVLRPAIAFRDSRALGPAETALAIPEVAGHPDARHLNGFHPLARLLWLKHNEPAAWSATALVLEPKDYLNFRLSGIARSDCISSAWLTAALRGAKPTLGAAAGIDRDVLPVIGAPTDRVGPVADGLLGALADLAGVPVFCGSNDTWTAVAGLGALKPGCAYGISGSSEVFGLMTGSAGEADGLITISWGEDLWQIGGPGQNGANVLAWIVDRLDRRDLPVAERLDSLLATPASRRPLLFFPYLNGERTPFWDRDLRAAFLGITGSHQDGDLVRAVMEGVAFVNRIVLERAERAAGHLADEVRLAGGGGRNAVWNQIRADVLGRRVRVSRAKEMGLAGAVAVARVGLGEASDFDAAAEAAEAGFTDYLPDPARRRRYDQVYSVFRDVHAAVETGSHRLAEIGRTPPG